MFFFAVHHFATRMGQERLYVSRLLNEVIARLAYCQVITTDIPSTGFIAMAEYQVL